MSLIACGMLLLTAKTDPNSTLASLAHELGVPIVVVSDGTAEREPIAGIDAKPLTTNDLERYMPIFAAEWRRYPRSLMQRLNLREVRLGSDLRVHGQPRAAIPDSAHGVFWLDGRTGSRIPAYGRHVLHHDFFHMIDAKDSKEGLLDPSWMALNPPSFRYGRGGSTMQSGNVGALRTDLPGFLTEYATSAVEEDKAEVFGFLLTNPAFVQRCVANDPVLAAKVKRIKSLVKAFDPSLNDSWWRTASQS